MNTIGIIGAMEEEVAILKEKMSDVTVLEKAGMEFYKGTLGGHPAVVVRSGIGKVNAGICTQILADLFQVEAVINTGVAGSLKAEINIGDIVTSLCGCSETAACAYRFQRSRIPTDAPACIDACICHGSKIYKAGSYGSVGGIESGLCYRCPGSRHQRKRDLVASCISQCTFASGDYVGTLSGLSAWWDSSC